MTDASEELELAKLVPKATFIDDVGAHLKGRQLLVGDCNVRR